MTGHLPTTLVALVALLVADASVARHAVADPFTWAPPGDLVSGSGRGRADDTVYVPGMRFPIEAAPAYLNSQVWGVGGSQGPRGGQCDAPNYSYPWYDNFCESRSWTMPLCPSGTGHQGQDMRASTCANNTHWAVAAESGTITSIGSYSVYLQADGGTRHRYLHMAPSSVQVRVGDRVTRGQRLGRVSNAFGGTPTTIHLHYDLYQNVSGIGGAYVPTYMSLVRSYEDLLGFEPEPCPALGPDGGVIDEDGPCGAFFGPATSWRRVDEGYGGELRWTYAWDEDRSNWARWDVVLEAPGRYEVSAWIVDGYASSTSAPYTVRHAGRESTVAVDIASASGWTRIGTFDFAADGDEWIALGDDSGEPFDLRRQIMVDAVLFTRILVPDPDPDPTPDPDPEPEPDPDPTPDPDPDPEPEPDPDPTPDPDAGTPDPDPDRQRDAGPPVRDEDAFATPDGFEDDDARRGPTIIDGGSTGGGASGWPDAGPDRRGSSGGASRVSGDTSNTAGCVAAGSSAPAGIVVVLAGCALALRRRR